MAINPVWFTALTVFSAALVGCSGAKVDEPVVNPPCPAPSTEVTEAGCPDGYFCQDVSETLRCKTKKYSVEQCTDAGGIPTADRGDGRLTPDQCPGAKALGAIDADWDEGGLCCEPGQACGGWAGNTCSSTEFCAYEPPDLCGAADAQATCKPRPEASCIELYAPVCGCDGKTYDNSCFANAAGTGIHNAGECASN